MKKICSLSDINHISKTIFALNGCEIEIKIRELQSFGLKVFEMGDLWIPKAHNSDGITKMIATASSIGVSLYIKKQKSITKEYATLFNCPYWMYNLLVPIHDIPKFFHKLKMDYKEGIIVPENKSPRGISGVFLETADYPNSARIPINFDPQ